MKIEMGDGSIPILSFNIPYIYRVLNTLTECHKVLQINSQRV